MSIFFFFIGINLRVVRFNCKVLLSWLYVTTKRQQMALSFNIMNMDWNMRITKNVWKWGGGVDDKRDALLRPLVLNATSENDDFVAWLSATNSTAWKSEITEPLFMCRGCVYAFLTLALPNPFSTICHRRRRGWRWGWDRHHPPFRPTHRFWKNMWKDKFVANRAFIGIPFGGVQHLVGSFLLMLSLFHEWPPSLDPSLS